jgi:SpoVK/Ycf46/Vps4 family AAA+-type ATPase
MSLRSNIEEMAASAAKRFDHAEIAPIHILFALRKKIDPEIQNFTSDSVEKELRKINISHASQLAISSEAQAILDEITSPEKARELAMSLAARLLDATDIESMKVGEGVEQFATKNELQNPLNLKESLEKLNSLIGLTEVKQQVQNLINVHQANNLRHSQGMNKIPVGLHCVFTGSPGTGKTTIARSVAEMYYCIGLLPTSNVIEVDRSRLVAGYVGQTALKVQEVIEEATGGVLFIDEAYALSADSGGGFGDEAIATLVKAMEDNRENLAIIVAGYKDPMKTFIESNQGLKSRFQNFIHFPDYSHSELSAIFALLCSEHQIKLNEEVKLKISSYFTASNPSSEDGNARFVRNLFEKMYLNLSNRAAADGKIEIHELTEFHESDIPQVEKKRSTIGFTQ